MYILAFKARCKNARRHIWGRYNTIEECVKQVTNSRYEFAIYDSRWNLIKEVRK